MGLSTTHSEPAMAERSVVWVSREFPDRELSGCLEDCGYGPVHWTDNPSEAPALLGPDGGVLLLERTLLGAPGQSPGLLRPFLEQYYQASHRAAWSLVILEPPPAEWPDVLDGGYDLVDAYIRTSVTADRLQWLLQRFALSGE